LRLPPYNCQYNPIELGWANCKNYYNKHIPSRLDSTGRVKEVWREALLQCTKEKWQNFIKHTDQEIKNDWHKYMGVHDIVSIPLFIINVSCDSSDSDDFSDLDEPPSDRMELDSGSEKITLMIVDDDHNN
jgi:hypothetical protein